MCTPEWFSRLDVGLHHRDLQLERIEGAGRWLINSPQFTDWAQIRYSSHDDTGTALAGRVFFLKWPLHMRQTFLTSLVVDYLSELNTNKVANINQSSGVGVFHIYYDENLLLPCQRPVDALGILLRQFHDAHPQQMEEFLISERKLGEPEQELTVDLATRLLNRVWKTFDMIFICIDGMDGWTDAEVRDFLQSLYESLYETVDWRVFYADAGYGRWLAQEECLGVPVGGPVDIPSYDNNWADTEKYIAYWTRTSGVPYELTGTFKKEIVSFFHRNRYKTYTLAETELRLRRILSEPTLFAARRNMLGEGPDWDLGKLVEDSLSRLQSLPGGDFMVRLLKVLLRKRTVTLKEFEKYCKDAHIVLPSGGRDSIKDYVSNTSLGLIIFWKASKTLRIAGYDLRKSLEKHNLLAETDKESTSPVNWHRLKDEDNSANVVRDGEYTYTYSYDKNGEPNIDIDIDYHYDGNDFDDPRDWGDWGSTAERAPKHQNTSTKRDRDDYETDLEHRISSAIMTEAPKVTWDHVAGLTGAKEALQEATILPQMFPSLYKDGAKHSLIRSILLYGPPGTGKTFLAKAVATETHRTFFSISVADLVSKWYGETERLIRQLFSLARQRGPSVVFIDEIDSLGGSRDAESQPWLAVQAELFVQLDGLKTDNTSVLVIGATNVPWHLDTALRRRFHRRIYIPLPDQPARQQMFKMNLGPKVGHGHELDYELLADLTEGFSGSDISAAIGEMLNTPLRAILRAKYFKKHENGTFEPCTEDEVGAVAQTYRDIPFDKAVAPPLRTTDLITALTNAKPTVEPAELARFKEWTKKFGTVA